MKMSRNEWFIFFAGAEAFHTLVHIMFSFAGMLPLTFFSIQLTPTLNMWAIIINGLITFWLLRCAKKI